MAERRELGAVRPEMAAQPAASRELVGQSAPGATRQPAAEALVVARAAHRATAVQAATRRLEVNRMDVAASLAAELIPTTVSGVLCLYWDLPWRQPLSAVVDASGRRP